ncbi:MAG: ABC transporter permease [Candidatus Moranbacteria bacterium]|nr:ABC transporter permease [Candidatus Moranbacteria bacterium]
MRLFFWRKNEPVIPDPLAPPELPKKPFFRRMISGILGIPSFLRNTFWRLTVFIVLLLSYVIARIVFMIVHRMKRLFHKGAVMESREILFARFFSRVAKVFSSNRGETIDKVSLIEVALRNMKVKKTRTAITVGGMALGIGSIVFLVSIGYGLQNLVVSQVARLDEMRQADVSPQTGGRIRIDDKTLASIKEFSDVDSVAPLVAVVGRVSYQNSISDMAVYGVTSDYLTQSAIQPVRGEIFRSNDLSVSMVPEESAVLGTEDEREDESHEAAYGEVIRETSVSSASRDWVRLREAPDPNAPIVGFVKVDGNPVSGTLVFGTTFRSSGPFGESGESRDGTKLGTWMKAEFPIWKDAGCENKDTCEDGYRLLLDETGAPIMKEGFFALVSDTLAVSDSVDPEGRVLGEETDTTSAATDVSPVADDGIEVKASGDDWVELALDGDEAEQSGQAEKISLGEAALREAVVNRAMIRVLGISEDAAVGQTFSASFVMTGNLMEGKNQKVESIPADYKIVGVIPDDKTPVFYVPFVDMRSLGIANYSQAKITVKTQEVLEDVRRRIEGMGYSTASVADTVEQINEFFGTARIVLALLGMAALGVAALGMFNTLTVSLLERTREVGLMKAMGMKASEVQELFLTESMVMSFFGGVVGLLVGWGAGKLLGAGISALALVQDRGLGFLDVSYIPTPFVAAILIFSIVVGIVTGLYPARRATKISALNALRYE